MHNTKKLSLSLTKGNLSEVSKHYTGVSLSTLVNIILEHHFANLHEEKEIIENELQTFKQRQLQ